MYKEQSPSWSCWPRCFSCRPVCHCPYWLPEHTAGSCAASCHPASPGPFLLGNFTPTFCQVYITAWVVTTQVQHLNFSLVACYMISCSPTTQILCRAFLPLSKSTALSNLVLPAKFLTVHSLLSSRKLIKVFDRTGPSAELWGTPPTRFNSVLLPCLHNFIAEEC